MNHPEIENHLPMAFGALFLADESSNPLLVPVVKATYRIGDGGNLILSEQPAKINMVGEHWGQPETTSYKYEPEVSFVKPRSDVVLIGHARALCARTSETIVTFCFGTAKKAARIVGDRYWFKRSGVTSATEAKPFENIPLVYERSFGGWDRSHSDPKRHSFEPRNPVGTGFRAKGGRFEEGVRLPNLEDPNDPVKNYGQVVKPVGFGFTSPHWQPRAALAGTYDEAWMKERMPLLPKDFDRRFFNAAPPDQIVPGYLRGDEEVSITNVTPSGRLAFRLPGVPPPECDVELKGGRRELLRTNLDTVIINTDENLVFLLWRAHLAVRDGPHGVHAIRVSIPDAGDAALAS